MDVQYRCCCGIDVHKESVTVNLLRKGVDDKADLNEVRSFSTMTHELLKLCEWLERAGCAHVAMESTGVYWKPIFNILEADFEVILVNAKHIKNVPGRKTDVKDCQWIAQLLQHGLLQASFIPPLEIRQLRDLTRERKKLIQDRSSVVNRIQKVLEDANIKLSSVATDVMGKSGWDMLLAIVEGEEDPKKLAALARGRLKAKKEELRYSLEGRLTDHHRFLLREYMRQIQGLDEMIERFDAKIEEQMKPFFQYIPLLDTIPGINQRAAENVVAEIGVNMAQFGDARHLCSWAGICPGNNESAGKHRSGKTSDGDKWLKATLVEAAWATSRMKGSYFAAQYRRIASRRGKKRALVALAHSMLVIIFHIMKDKVVYRELGPDFFDRLNTERLKRYLTKRLESLGYKVEVSNGKTAA
jgi:transposase